MPADLAKTAELVGYTPLAIDEDKLQFLSKIWRSVERIFQRQADAPLETPGTFWNPTTQWVRGSDRALDAFVELQAGYDQLSRRGHMLGGAYHALLGVIPFKGEDGDDGDADVTAINVAMQFVPKLNSQTQASINQQANIIAQATKALDRVSDNATKTTSALTGGSADYTARPDNYNLWASAVVL
ncbi:hypothetical protein GCM10027176_58060 [Actinoallomurus bryophytorum]|uniref:Uncharacterized protein n=1 Tax=Actinoallomurus bryophytorum TaxID=1490222 RepID=A0A543CCU3_9ACTN|nr:hypothetical protein [Actinoallomurus bryophytorum]TQL94913.1 hypothetical protein FB559_0400 [Actinoallomurus bryophytorum]